MSAPAPRPVTHSPAAFWEPSRNAIHRLIQYMDVLAIAFNKFRQLSFDMPRAGTPEYSPDARTEALQHLAGEYTAVTHSIFRPTDIVPQHAAKRFADDALAAAVHLNLPDPEPAIDAACCWVAQIGWVRIPRTAEFYYAEWEQQFGAQGDYLMRYTACRDGLISLLARGGHRIPATIRQRSVLAFKPLAGAVERPMSVAELQRLVYEAEEEGAVPPTPPPPLFPRGTRPPIRPRNPHVADAKAVEELLPQVEADAARYLGRLALLLQTLRDAISIYPTADTAARIAALERVNAQVDSAGVKDAAQEIRDGGRWDNTNDPATKAAGYGVSDALARGLADLPEVVADFPEVEHVVRALHTVGNRLLYVLRGRAAPEFARRFAAATATWSDLTHAALEDKLTPAEKFAHADWQETIEHPHGPHFFHPLPLTERPVASADEPESRPEDADESEAKPPTSRRGGVTLERRDPPKWKLYQMFYADYVRHPGEQTASLIKGRLKDNPEVKALCPNRQVTAELIRNWEKHFRENGELYAALGLRPGT